MAYINDSVLDSLSSLAGATVRVDICYGTLPAIPTFAQATSTASCGNKKLLPMTAIAAGSPDGRKVDTPAIADGAVTSTQLAEWWAITDDTSVVYAAGALSATHSVVLNDTFTLDAISITNRDAV